MCARDRALSERERIIAQVGGLPDSWHSAGTLSATSLAALSSYIGPDLINHSLETGTGKSTLLLSHLSLDHKVFTIAGDQDSSYAAVVASPLLNKESVEFIIGPTQLTLPTYRFIHRFELVLLDGPHAYPFPDLEYFYTYPHLADGGLLVLDDIHIPTIFNLFKFVREDAMFELVEVVGTTAFLRRTGAPLFPPDEDNWVLQRYNLARFPISNWPAWGGLRPRIRNSVPMGVRKRLRGIVPPKLRKWLIS